MRRIGVLILLLTLCLSGQVFAWFNFTLDEPIYRLADNSAVDIVFDGTYVWLGTGNGISGTSDGGTTWVTFNESTGFTHSSISGLATDGQRLWAATAYDFVGQDGQLVPAGGGIQITEDHGGSFQLIDDKQFSSSGMLAYDLAVHDSAVWAACYYGGLVRSLDYGATWENVFISDALRQDFENEAFDELAGRYFSVQVDPFHDDSVIVWAGSAEGIQRIYYIGKSKKLASNRINDISYDGTFWWYATDRGLSRLDDTLFSLFSDTVITTYTFLTYDTSDGFSGNNVSAVGAEGDLICCGLYDTLAQSSLGFAISTDGGGTWTSQEPSQAIGANRMIEEIEVYHGYIWAGCDFGGFIRSADNGETWRNFYLDSTITELSDLRNIAHGFDISPREEYTKVTVGTDTGVVAFYFTDLSELDSTSYMTAHDNLSHGQKMVSVATTVVDGVEQVWAIAYPLHEESGAAYAVVQNVPGFDLWNAYINQSPNIVPYDIEVLELETGTSIWVAHDHGLYVSTDFGSTWNSPYLRDRISHYPQIILIDNDEPFLSVEVGDSILHVGSQAVGALEMVIPISDWFIFAAQTDPLQFDVVGRSYRTGSVLDTSTTNITGNFVTALGVQRAGDSSIVWASTKPTSVGGYIGVSITTNRGKTWKDVGTGIEVWNFEFNGDSTILASEQGLLLSTDFGANWEQIDIVDPNTGRTIGPDVPVYAVRLIEGDLWVGTEDGIAVSSDGENWAIYRTFYDIDPSASDNDRTYVSPNPYSPYISSGDLKFHYYLEHGGEVTIKVYDFANNLVKVVTDRQRREADQQYDDFDLWDGRNEKGDIVAGGVYIYLIESSGGDELWGKLMVLP